MAQSLRLADGGNRSSAYRAFTPSDDQRRRAASSTSDQDLARLTRANLFIAVHTDVVARYVTSLSPHLAAPLVVRYPGEPLQLSPTSRPVGTIVVYDVDTLTPQEQDELSRWIAAGNRQARVVSTASQFLLPLVETGAFDGGLYYRLNVLTLDLTSPGRQ